MPRDHLRRVHRIRPGQSGTCGRVHEDAGSQDAADDRIESLLITLLERQRVQQWYTTAEAAKLLGKSEFTVREHCRLGRIHAKKQSSGRGAYPSWAVSHEEILRIQRDGLLPVNNMNPTAR